VGAGCRTEVGYIRSPPVHQAMEYAGDPKRNRPLIEFSPGGNISSPGDSISAKCEMDSPGGRGYFSPLRRESCPPHKNVPKRKNCVE